MTGSPTSADNLPAAFIAVGLNVWLPLLLLACVVTDAPGWFQLIPIVPAYCPLAIFLALMIPRQKSLVRRRFVMCSILLSVFLLVAVCVLIGWAIWELDQGIDYFPE